MVNKIGVEFTKNFKTLFQYQYVIDQPQHIVYILYNLRG